jgi:hypothetical protein
MMENDDSALEFRVNQGQPIFRQTHMYPHFLAKFGRRAAKGQAMFVTGVIKETSRPGPNMFFSIHITNKTTCRTFG